MDLNLDNNNQNNGNRSRPRPLLSWPSALRSDRVSGSVVIGALPRSLVPPVACRRSRPPAPGRLRSRGSGLPLLTVGGSARSMGKNELDKTNGMITNPPGSLSSSRFQSFVLRPARACARRAENKEGEFESQTALLAVAPSGPAFGLLVPRCFYCAGGAWPSPSDDNRNRSPGGSIPPPGGCLKKKFFCYRVYAYISIACSMLGSIFHFLGVKMARIIGGNPNGFWSGKVGGLVYSFNRVGQYVRQYVKPVNPATNAQTRARAAFAGSSGTYHALNVGEKAAWGSFASTVFNPKVGLNNGQFSGFNAFVSLKNVTENGNGLVAPVTGEVDGVAVGTPLTFSDYAFSETPPVFTIQAAIKEQVTGNPLNLSMRSAEVKDDGSFEIQINVGSGGAGSYAIEDFIDPNDQEFGFLVQMSNPNPQGGMFYQNPFQYTLGYIKHPSIDSADAASVGWLGFVSTGIVNPGNYQGFPVAGNFVRITVYTASRTGMLALVGNFEVEVDS